MKIAARPLPVARRLLPILGWLPAYRREWFAADFLAALAIWAVMVPEGMAYAGIVGVPPIMGLYTVVLPLVAYALLGTSRLLVVGPDTATGLISALTVSAFAMQGTADFDTLTSTLAVLIGVFFLLFGALRMGWVAAFIPTPVMRGFIEGLVCVTIIGQVPHLLGIGGTSGNFFDKLRFLLQHLPDVSLAPMLAGLLSLVAMLFLRRLIPRLPAALVVAVIATIVVGLLGGEAAGISIVGDLPSGMPHLVVPNLDPAILWELAPGALAIVLVGYAEALGGAKAAAMQGGGDIDPNQELIAHGPANILSGLFGGFLVVGSLSKTSVAMAAGARTQIANLIAAVFCFLTLVLLTPLFRDMPHPALAAIVIAAMLHLSKPGYLRDLFFASIGRFDEDVRAALAAQRPPARDLLVDAEAIDFIDVSACDALLGMVRRLHAEGVGIGFARLRDEVRERMRQGGVEAAVGADNFFERVTDGVQAWQAAGTFLPKPYAEAS